MSRHTALQEPMLADAGISVGKVVRHSAFIRLRQNATVAHPVAVKQGFRMTSVRRTADDDLLSIADLLPFAGVPADATFRRCSITAGIGRDAMRDCLAVVALAALTLAMPASAQDAAGQMMSAKATMTSSDGSEIGTVTFDENGNGVLIRARFSDLPPGEHAFHIHQTGSCEDDFQAAGDHYAPRGNEHGTLNAAGSHAGDLPNVWATEGGEASHDVITSDVTLSAGATGTLFDEDGSAMIVHENPDSYRKDAGAGGRIACGVIERVN